MENQQRIQNWPKFDIVEGSIKTYFQIPKNKIYTQEYSFNIDLLLTIVRSIINPSSLILIITLILTCSLQAEAVFPHSKSMPIIQLILIMSTMIIKQIIINKSKVDSDQKINKRIARVFRGDKEFEKLQWGQIQQGDIVYLCQGQVAPADIIILDSQQVQHREAITYVDTKNINGETIKEKKKSCYLTQILNKSSNQKRVWQQYKKIISGRITFQKPSATMDSFTGYLKLAKDPKVQKLSIQNLILRQSTIKTSLWVYGLVLYTGMDSKIMKSFKQGTKSRRWSFGYLNLKFLMLVLLYLFLGLIFSAIYIYNGNQQSNLLIFCYHCFMFIIMLPHLIFVAKDLFIIVLKLTRKIYEVQIRDQQNIQNLGKINFAVISNIGVLTDGKLQVKQIVTQSSVYGFEDDNLNQDSYFGPHSRLHCRRLGSSLKNEQSINLKQPKSVTVNNKFLLPIMNYDKKVNALVFKQQNGSIPDQNFQIDDDTNIRLKQTPMLIAKSSKVSPHLEPLKLDRHRFYNYVKRNQNESTQIIKTLGLCHQAKLYYVSNKQKYQGVSNLDSQQVLLKLVGYVGWNLTPKNIDKKQVGLIIAEEKERKNEQNGLYRFETIKNTYYWVGINSFSIPRKLFSVVVSINNKYTLYCKGKYEDIMERLKVTKQTQKIIQQTLTSYAKKQSQVLIYAKRQLSYQEKQIYENDYVSLKSSLTTTQRQIQQFSRKYQKNLEFICIIGMSPKMNPEAQPLMRHIRQCGIKPCVFGNQKSETTFIKNMILQQNEDCKQIQIEGQSAQLIKYYLNEATNLINNNQNLKYLLMINGVAWKTIRSNSQLMQHFMFVLYYAQGMIAIKFKSEDIGELTRNIRYSYPEDQKVLGIGYSYSDLKFLGQSNVSISTCQDLPTDIKVEELNRVSQILKYGPYLLKVKLSLYSVVLYRTIVMSTVTLVYQIFMSYFGTSRTINGHLICFYLIIYTSLQLAYTLFNYRNPVKTQEGSKYNSFKKSVNKNFPEYIQAFIHGIIISTSLIFSLPGVRVQKSKILPIEAYDLSIFMTLILVACLRNIFNSSFTKLSYLVTSLISVSSMALLLYGTSFASVKISKIIAQFSNIVTTYDSIVCIINCTVFCLCISLFIEQIIKKLLLIGYASTKKMGKLEKKQNKKKMIEMIEHLYKQQQNMEGSIQQIVSTQLDVNNLKINKFLCIKKEEDNIKYLSHKLSKNVLVFLRLNIIMTVFFVFITIIDTLVVQKQFENYQITCIIGIGICLMFSILWFFKQQIFMCYYRLMAVQLVIIATLLLAFSFYREIDESFLLICCISVIFTQSININFFVLLFLMVAVIVICTVQTIIKSNYTTNRLMYSIFQIVCITYNFLQFYQIQKASKISFIRTQTFERQSNYVNDILSILVPKFIKNHLQDNQYSLQQQQKKVSILFCYVCNFDEIVKQEGTNVVTLMDELFRQFDQLCHNFAVQKIETVGQTYMAATGIKAYQDEIQTEMKKRNQVERLLKMAIQMLEKSKDIMWGIKKNKKLNLKIGIHHGNVIIGVIGFHKPQFSLIGDAVNTTSRHCSTASAGQIVVSHVAFELLKKFPASSFTKSIKTMKGLGQVPIYRYNNNELKELSHKKMRIKFQIAVRKVIENLKQQGKIKYKNFRASQFAEKVMLYERTNTKKMTRASQPRKTLQYQLLSLDTKKGAVKQIKFLDSCVKYNRFMQLQGNSTQFKKDVIKRHQSEDKKGLCILAVIYLINFAADILTKRYSISSLALCSISILLFPIMFILYRKFIKHKIFNICYILAHAYIILSINLHKIINQQYETGQSILSHSQKYYAIMAITVCSSQKAFRLIHTVSFALFILIVQSIQLIKHNYFSQSIVFQMLFCSLIIFRKYSYMRQYYDNYNQSQIDQKKTLEQSALVSQLLPKHAYQKLKNQNNQNKLQLTDKFEGATILFADIKGFTSYSNKNTPSAVVKMLRQLFEQFDKLCLKYNVYKVYTIGDCYVVLGFTNCYQRDLLQQAKNVVNMGLAMVETIQRVRQNLDFSDLDMRIGIHTGTIIGGIIGTQIVRYDIYGPDVMVANKFEQYGKTGFIHISESTKQILDQDKRKSFNIVPNGIVKVQKLNAQYNGYILTKKKFEI